MPVIEAEPLEIVSLPELKYGGPGGRGPDDSGWDGHGGGDGDDDAEPAGYSPDLGILGMRLMLVSIVALFVALSLAYIARARSPKFWQPVAVPHLLWISTAIIILSSLTLEVARHRLWAKQNGPYLRWLGATVALGMGFLGSQVLSLELLLQQGAYFVHNPHSSMFFIITGVHGMHLFVGIAMLIGILIQMTAKPELIRTHFRRQKARNSVAALYWHTLDGLWLGLFAILVFVGR